MSLSSDVYWLCELDPFFLHVEIKGPSLSPGKLLATVSLACGQFDARTSLAGKTHFLCLAGSPNFFLAKMAVHLPLAE